MSRCVLVIGEFGSLNGGENSFLAVAPELLESGWKLIAAVPDQSDFSKSLEECGIETTPFSTFDEPGNRKSQTQVRQDLGVIFDRVKPDLIHCNSLSTSRLVGPVASKKQIPSLGYLRDILKLSQKAIADINLIDRLVAVSRATKKWHCEQGIDPQRTSVIYNGVDTELFRPQNSRMKESFIRTELSIPETSPVLLFVGQIGMRKGIDTLITSFLKIADGAPTTHLLIVGQRHSQKQEAIDYEQLARDAAMSSLHNDNIHWLETRTDIPAIMRSSSILIHPANQEPLGRVLLEAAATGLPIVTTNVGGSPEILRGLEQYMVGPRRPDEMASVVLEMLEQPDQMEVYGRELREIAKQTFSICRCARQLSQHYSDLTSR